MERALRCGVMVVTTTETFSVASKKEKDATFGPMAVSIRALGQMTK